MLHGDALEVVDRLEPVDESWHTAVAIHNANPQLAIDALIAQLRELPEVDAR